MAGIGIEPARRPRVREGRLLATLAAAALSFLLSLAYSQHCTLALRETALEIANNATPSIEHLSSARAELYHLAALVDGYVDGMQPDPDRGPKQVEAIRQQIGQSLAAYFLLPSFPGERNLWQKVHEELWHLDRAVGQIFAHVEAHDAQGARLLLLQDFSRATSGASGALMQLISFNSQTARELAARAELLRRRSLLAVVVLALASLWLSAMMAVLVRRGLRLQDEAEVPARPRLVQDPAARARSL